MTSHPTRAARPLPPRGRTTPEPAGRRAPGARPRRWGTLAGLAALLALCVVAGMWLWQQAGQTTEVIVVSTDVQPGETIERGDLTSTSVSGIDYGFTVDEVDAVVGTRARVGLTAGQVVARSGVTTAPVPGGGLRSVGLELGPARMPSGLRTGDLVSVIEVPIEGGEVTADQLTAPRVLTGRAVVQSVAVTQSGDSQLTITVPEGSADAVAAHAAAGRVAVTQVSMVH